MRGLQDFFLLFLRKKRHENVNALRGRCRQDFFSLSLMQRRGGSCFFLNVLLQKDIKILLRNRLHLYTYLPIIHALLIVLFLLFLYSRVLIVMLVCRSFAFRTPPLGFSRTITTILHHLSRAKKEGDLLRSLTHGRFDLPTFSVQ
jgi:hypothetical protein